MRNRFTEGHTYAKQSEKVKWKDKSVGLFQNYSENTSIRAFNWEGSHEPKYCWELLKRKKIILFNLHI
jgi:hypothetical protein